MKRIDKDVAVGCAFMFMGKACLTKNEIDSYLEILNGLLPEDYILYGVSNVLDFIEERYKVIKQEEGLYYITGNIDAFNYYFIFRTPSAHLALFKEACTILQTIEEMSDEITTKENMSLKKTI